MNEDVTEPKEISAGRLRWVSRSFYKDIGELQADLNKEERRLLIAQLDTTLTRYEHLTLSIKEVRDILYLTFNKMLSTGIITSQLSRKFNMSKIGHNDQVKEEIENAFRDAYEKENENCPEEAARILQGASLSHKQLFSKEITAIVRAKKGAAASEWLRVQQYQNRLFKSTLKMAIRISKKHVRQLDGSTVEWQDLVQEAVIAAQQAVEAYRPIESGKTFTSFVHTWVSGVVSKKVNETTRTVFIPRTTLDRFSYVSKAVDDLGLMLGDLRGGAWQDGKRYEGKVDYATLGMIADRATRIQKRDRGFTPEEVQELILTTQDEVSMDLEIDSDHDVIESLTFGDSMVSEAPPADEALDGALFGRRLMAILREYTTDEEYALLELRWGMGSVKSYKTVAEEFAAGTHRPMNKGKVALIEKQVFARIQQEAASDPDLMKKFKEITETASYIPEN